MAKLWSKGKIILLAFIAIIAVALILKDGIITYFLEKYASEANRAKVDVEGLKLNIFKQTLTWDRLQVTDPNSTMENLIDTGDLKVEIEIMPLLENRIIIDKFELDNVNFNTERKKDGKIPGLEPRPKLETPMLGTFKKKLEEGKKNIPILNIKELDSKEELQKILDQLDIQILKTYNDDKAYIEDRVEYWKTAISPEKYKEETANLKASVDALKQELQNMEPMDVTLVNEKLEKINKLNQEINKVVNSIKGDKTGFENEFKEIKKRSENFSAVARTDFSKIAAFKDIGSENWKYVSKALFGEDLSEALYNYVELFEAMTEKLEESKGKETEETPEPKFWIKDGDINLVYKDLSLKGDIKNLVDDNIKIDSESAINILGEALGKKVKLNVLLDTRSKLKEVNMALENFSMSKDFRGYYLKPFSGSNFDILQNVTIKDGILDLETKLNFDEINLTNVAQEIPIENEKIRSIYLDTLKSVKGLVFDIGYRNNGEFFQFDTNIDDILASNIRSNLTKEIEKFQANLRKSFDARVSSLQKDLESKLTLAQTDIESRIKLIEGEILKNTDSLEEMKKELLKNKVGEGLDIESPMDIFKKLR